jgi:exodeoxyribonuclease V alpha subunit
MTVHLTARVAWHDGGWDGHVCERPELNSYCVGCQSYPGDVIARERQLETEKANAGKHLSALKSSELPPCVYSINAFGAQAVRGYSNPPNFFYDGASRTEWDIPAATTCVWPYEAMYSDDVYKNEKLDNNQRSANADEFFKSIDAGSSLIFYYANYSNPFTEEESPKYVLVGVSRVKNVSDRLTYDNVSETIAERFAGGMIWARNISSLYPDEGLRLPYHRYRDDPEILNRFVIYPENPRTCKYGARLLSDDDAIGLLEQFLGAIHELREIGDESENWSEREKWVLGCIAELWTKRGLYPGLLNVMRFLSADPATDHARRLMASGKSKEAHSLFFDALDNGTEVAQYGLLGRPLQKLARQWKLKPDDAKALLRDILPRLDLSFDQIERIVSEDERLRETHNLPEDCRAPFDNPYLLSERYVGDSPDDTIAWGTIDRGVLPSPELGGEALADMEYDDARRLRSLCIEQLKREPNQTFRAAEAILAEVNARLQKLPEWKTAHFTARYFEVDKDTMEEALVLRKEEGRFWLYLQDVYEDEREIEDALTKLAGRANIQLQRPFSEQDWKVEIVDTKSPLLAKARDQYQDAVAAQASACASIFRKPLAVVTGAAGTGKTTVICALIRAVRQTEGDGAPIAVMAPTGKASDRVRAKLHQRGIARVDTSTVHSFLAKGGWLNDNLTLRRRGGKKDGAGTLIIDEASMLDLGLMASLVRSIDWRQVRRLILVGDPNQLPPIGRGRVFADTIIWMDRKNDGSVARLDQNLRQMENTVEGNGTAILGLANLFVGGAARDDGETTSVEAEALLSAIHKGGKVDEDLRVVYWDAPENLSSQLINTIEAEMSEHTAEPLNQDKPYELWRKAFDWKPEKYQVLTPHRGEAYGVAALNDAMQKRIARGVLATFGAVDGITLFDKVIQYRNRPRSNAIWAYNYNSQKSERVEVFNGEIGFVQKHGYDGANRRFRLKRFQVKFASKDHLGVGYGRELASGGSESVENNLELAYAISVHKAQGSEFDHTYVLVPKSKGHSLSSELIYTALTRATKHCTLLVQGDVSTLLSARRPENTQTGLINSSLFDGLFHAVPDALVQRKGWYEEGKIHQALGGDMVRSKSELVIANLLHEREVPFQYETALVAPDGTMYLPDFTITWNGEKWYWEHWGMMSSPKYAKHREDKIAWYQKHFGGRLLETFEGTTLSAEAAATLERILMT